MKLTKRKIKSRAVPLLMTSDEKHELIRAHAAMRTPHDPVQMLSVWAGVLVAFVVVIGGWMWAIQPTFSSFVKQPIDPETRALFHKTASIGRDVGSTSPSMGDLTRQAMAAVERLDRIAREAEQNEHALERMAAAVNSTSTIFTITSTTHATTTRRKNR